MALKDVPGQPRAKRFLGKLFESTQVPHALLFSGMEGIGKSALALQFAKLLNCLAPVGHDCCDRCSACLKIENGTHPDLLRIRADGAFIKLDQIRELRSRLRFPPFEGNRRVIVIENSQSLREEAANAILKLLEEPPGRNVFLVTTLEPQMLLPTIVSRCCHIRFQPLDEETLASLVVARHSATPEKAREVARLAEGSMTRAMWLCDENRVEQWKDTIGRVESLGDIGLLELFPLVAQWVQKSENLEQDLECIKLWMRDVILCRILGNHRPLFDLDGTTLRAAVRSGIDTLFSIYGHIEQALHRLRQNANKILVLEGMCLVIKDSLYGKGCWDSISQRREDLSF